MNINSIKKKRKCILTRILLQNTFNFYYKRKQGFFITKRDENLLQNASVFLLQNASILLQNAAGITKRIG